MASHKVIQDIEAEDKFVGPLTLRQFVFAMIGTFFGYLNVFAMSKGATWALLIFTPPALFCFFLAVPWSKTQPTEIWFLAKLRFHFKPKRRVWDQSGLQELVTITAPKRIEKILTKSFSQDEVKSRLKALADTIDSRGWAVKNTTLEAATGAVSSDRLIDPAALPQEVPEEDLRNIPDLMDEQSAPLASNLEHMIEDSDKERKERLYDKMQRVRSGQDIEAAAKAPLVVTPPAEEIPPVSAGFDEKLIAAELKAKKASSSLSQGRMHSIPASVPSASEKAAGSSKEQGPITDGQKTQAEMTTPVPSATIERLAHDDDKDVATLSRMAREDKDDDGEVVISLH